MRTNVNIELSDEQRDRIANAVDGKQTKRLLTRAEVVEMTEAFWAAMAAEDTSPQVAELDTEEFEEPVRRESAPRAPRVRMPIPARVREMADKLRASGKSEDWVRSWTNGAMQVVNRSRRAS